jgi:peptidoglycan/xylan/chitin deacetylase (PgdA/CDA1 family)
MKRCIAPLICLLVLGCKSITVPVSQTALPEKVVVFTFDDGPNAHGETTERLLAVLEKHNIKAAFALLGVNAEYNPDLVRRIGNAGHTIINHGYGETWAIKLNDDEFTENLLAGENAIKLALGKEINILFYRPQGGFYKKSQKRIWEARAYTMVPGSARAHDAVLAASARTRLVSDIIKKVESQNGGIILLHDARDSYVSMEKNLAKKSDGVFNRTWIPEAVEEIIIELEKKNYRLSGFDINEVLANTKEKIR